MEILLVGDWQQHDYKFLGPDDLVTTCHTNTPPRDKDEGLLLRKDTRGQKDGSAGKP